MPRQFCLALPLVVLLTASLRGQEVDLRPKFEKGQEVRYRMELSSVSQIRAGEGQQQEQKLRQEIRFLMRVVEAPREGPATVELVYEALKVSAASPMGNVEFDSDTPRDKDPGNMLAPSLRPVVGGVLTLTIEPTGNIAKVAGGEGFMGMAQQLGQASSVRQLFGPIITTRAPRGSAKVGESWEHVDTVESGMLGKFRMTARHTLESATSDEARLTFRGQIQPDTEAPEAPGFKVRDSRFEGQYAWDLRQGLLRSLESTQRMTAEGALGGQEFSMTSDAVTKVTRLLRTPG